MILVSLLVGVAAVVLAARWIGQQATVATKKVVVAVRDLEVGTRLRPDMLQVAEWPLTTSLKESFSAPSEVDGRVINQQVLRGEPILSARLAAPGEKGGLSAVLEQGKRAITVKVNEIVGVAGFALPGNYVDVMVNTPDESNRPVSKIVLERILVLAVAQDVSTGDNKPRVVNAVTLEVTPQQAEQIDLARSIGQLSLVLRSQVDKESSPTLGARKTDLLKLQPVAVVPAAAAADVPVREAQKAAGAGPARMPAARKSAAAVPPVAAGPAKPGVEVIRGLKRSSEASADAPAN
ncbi:MAG: Flp pilus assembly protein CpaB [Burkholderiales bacterium]|nr:Flp pilus assembly protein CpaB [Burkholderiales bacterium]